MLNLKIHIYKPGSQEPDKRITIPFSAIHIAQKLLPKKARDALAKEGIDLGVLQEVAHKEGPKGTLMEIEDAKKRIVISVE